VEEICAGHALYFDNGDSRSMVGAIERLLDEEGLAEDRRMRGRAHAASLIWAASARALGDVVRRLR
jgi:glycosyltransferase involved in cell wall biosynthesis